MVYTCLQRSCGHDFNQEEELIEHLINNHNLKYENIKNQNEIYFKCLNCWKKLDCFDQIMKHLCRYHLDTVINKSVIVSFAFFFVCFILTFY
jgi:hypothetical protein